MALGKGLQSLIPQQNRNSLHRETASGAGQTDKIWRIPLTDIIPNTEQPRKDFSHQDLEDLVVSIKKYGVIQPITVTENANGGYELIAGERRFRASQIAGMVTIPALVRTATQQEKLELALIENIQRQNLNAIEEAFSFQRLIDEFGLTQQQVADNVGKSRPAIANAVRLLELPDEIQKSLIDGRLSAGKARALLSLKDEKEQIKVFESMVGVSASVRDVEQAVAQKGPASRKGSVRRDPNVTAQEQLLEERLGTKVQINQRGAKGSITIHYFSKEELKRLLDEMVS